ncbi:HD-GYP domain-containing protein [Salipaludibacillus daqingensis]|uniref:HD-GYP domain-containing protein n=1 Tax=Salipaludibacillus daqingensis TaxID=3041001 RepID=UPI002475F106|nr:HD domain-containing phosphohydrolase [Salipaludibacillus daqingensis]
MDQVNIDNYAHLALDRRLASDILSESGSILLREGMVITPSHIRLLRQNGIKTISVSGHTSFLEQLDQKCKEQHKPFIAAYRDQFHRLEVLFNSTEADVEVDVTETLDAFDQLATEALRSHSLLELLQQLEGHEGYLLRHSIHVGLMTSLIAKLNHFPDEDVIEIGKAGLLHDIGMVKLPETIFNKPDTLSPEETDAIFKHTEIGYDMLQKQGVSQYILDGAFYHHERMDGSGYPKERSGDDIPKVAQMIAIADVFDAVSSDRIFRKKQSPFKALSELKKDIYEKRLSAVYGIPFINHMVSVYTGTEVFLSDGRTGKIILFNAMNIENPLISVDGDVHQLNDLKGVTIQDIADNRLKDLQGEEA